MRVRPFLQAGESPRPFSEVLRDRRGDDERERWRREIERLEAAAAAAQAEGNDTERQALQCQAEDLRCALQGV